MPSDESLKRADDLGSLLGLDDRDTWATERSTIAEAFDEAVAEAVHKKIIELTTHPALVCCHQAHITDVPIGLCRTCKQRVDEAITRPAVAEERTKHEVLFDLVRDGTLTAEREAWARMLTNPPSGYRFEHWNGDGWSWVTPAGAKELVARARGEDF